MKRMMAFALSTVLALSLASCGAAPEKGSDGGASASAGVSSAIRGSAEAGSGVRIPSPITEYDSLDEAAEAAGFSLTVPETIDGCPERTFQVFNANTDEAMLEVICRGGEEDVIHIRKAPGTEDISGDYTQYAESSSETVGDVEVTVKGSGGQAHLATWTGGGYTYSISARAGMSSSDMSALVRLVK